MKKIFSLFLCAVMAASVLFCTPVASFAQEDNQITVSADSSDITEDLRAALKQAGLSATPENRFTVKVEPGTYELTRGLNIYSNTNFDLTGVTFIKANGFSGATMLKTGLADDVSKGYDYYKNITVIGGTFDANAASIESNAGGIWAIHHTDNFKVSGTTLKNCRNSHHISIAGCRNVTVDNCTFENSYRSSGNTANNEAVQLDILDKRHYSGLPAASYDGTANKNIKITNCRFNKVNRGVGSHSSQTGNYMNGFVVKNNTFNNVDGYAVTAVGIINCDISYNKINNCGAGIFYRTVNQNFANTYHYKDGITRDPVTKICNNVISTKKSPDKCFNVVPYGVKIYGVNVSKNSNLPSDKDSNGKQRVIKAGDYRAYNVTVSSNTVTVGYTGYGIWLNGSVGTKVSSNKITLAKNTAVKDTVHAFRADYCSSPTVSSNSINGNNLSYSGNGINLTGTSGAKLTSNTVTKFKKSCVLLDKKSSASLSKNKVSYSGDHGVYVRNSSKAAFSKNTVSNNKYKGVYFKDTTAANTMSGDKISANGEHGVAFSNSKCKLTYVTSSKNSGYGIYSSKKSRVTVAKCTVSSNKKDGIYCNNKSSTAISSCTVSSNKGNGIYFTSGAGGSVKSTKITSNKKYGIYKTKKAKKVAVSKVKYSKNKSGKIKK